MSRREPAGRTVLLVASLGVFMAFVDATIVNIAFPDIGRSFPGESVGALSWVLNAYNIVFAAFLLAGGKLADLLGRKRVFMWGLVIFTLASALCAIAGSVDTLVAYRVLQAVGAALLVPASLALVLEAFPPDRRAHAVAMFSAVAALAAGIGPSLGGLLIEISDWRLVFIVNVPVGIATYLLSRRHLVESRAPGRRRVPDLPGSVIFAVAVSLLVFGVVKGETWGFGDPRVLGSWAAAAALGAVFVWRSRHHRAPLFELNLLRNRTFSASNAMTIVAAAGFYGYTLVNVLWLIRVWEYSALEAGLAMTPGPFVAAAVAGPTSKLAVRIGHRYVLIVGALIWGAGLFWFVTQVGLEPAFVSEWLPGMVILGIGAGATFPNLSGAAVASAPGESFGTATGLNSVARQVGAALGVAIVVAIIGQPTPLEVLDVFDNAWTFCAVALLVSGVGCVLVGRIGEGDDVSRTPPISRATFRVLNLPERRVQPAVHAPVLRESAPQDATARDAAGATESTADFLARVPLFAELAEPLREVMANRSREVRLGAGETLFKAGDPADALYVIRAGRLEVLTPDGAVASEMGRGAALGELGLLSAAHRVATVRAARYSDLIRIGKSDFDALLERSPELSRALNKALAHALAITRQSAVEGARPRASTIALVPLDTGVPLPVIASGLVDAMGRYGPVTALNGREVAPPDNGAGAVAAYGPMLDRAEAESDQTLLITEPGGNEAWNAFCLQQADRIVAISSGGALWDAAASRPELRGCDLVGWNVAVGSGRLEQWVDALDPVEAHALHERDLQASIARLGRRLSGNSVGLVLSGGGARGFSHIGVLEELAAAGIGIDRVAGVSMGAFIGGMFAMGMDAEEIDARCYDEWVRRRPLADYTVPRHSLIRGQRAEAMLQRTFGSARIEELDRSFVATTADLRTGEQVATRHGPIWEAVGLSMAIPVLVPPIVRDGKLLVDGSLVDNLPIGVMAGANEGPIIAVDLKTSFEPPPRRRDEPEEDPLPAIGETLTRVVFSGSSDTSAAARRHADLIINPRNIGVGLFEWHQIDRARESGRAAARDAIERAPASVLG
jgi:EmrB/QacA subfamily drug resistance transporter